MSLLETIGPAAVTSLTNTADEELLFENTLIFHTFLQPIPTLQQRSNSLSFLTDFSVWLYKFKLKFTAFFFRGVFAGIGISIVDYFVAKGMLFTPFKR